MNAIVVYKSSTGFTRQYAEMVASALECTAVKLEKAGNLAPYELIIFGGWVRASKVVGLKTALKKAKGHHNGKIVVFAVGANEKSDANTARLKSENLKDESAAVPLFYLQGGFAPEKLNFFMHAMLKNVAKSIEKKANANPEALSKEDREFLDFFQSSHDDVSAENMAEMLAYIRESY
jgi:menaquinone-dependent protoporphyrinogen IX oxidase